MKILVVDDDKKFTNPMKSLLESECFVVDVAHDGEKGLFYARTNDYDIILLDNNMPKKNGLSVCSGIREDGISVPIIIISVLNETLTKIDLLNAGADDYIPKPFSHDELVARIKALLRRPKKIESEVITLGAIRINTANNRVFVNDKPKYLTNKEYMLLEYLAKNKDTIVSRGSIIEHVWDMNADPFSNTIEVHVRNIRKKLQKNLIKTIPGRGYMIE